jgi:hypothetical protein
MSNAPVGRAQRFTKAQPCPICHGYDQAPRGQAIRCFGFLSDDGTYAHCTREEHAGSLSMEAHSDTYAHKLIGNCRCGVRHDPSLPHGSPNGDYGKRLIATYPYVDEQGTLLYEAVRYAPKTFKLRRPDGHGGWIWNMEGVRPVLYGLPTIVEAIAQEQVICIAEGEEDGATGVIAGKFTVSG